MEPDEALAAWRARYPEITERDAWADLWHQGVKCKRSFVAMNDRLMAQENAQRNVVEHPDQLAGWKVSSLRSHKPGVLRYTATKAATCINGFVRCDVLRVAIETGVIEKPDGYVT